jgi:formylglycine-generating enzyme required for sulfatase activity
VNITGNEELARWLVRGESLHLYGNLHMKDIVRLKLVEIVTRYGQGIIEDPRRMEGLLNDFCGDHKREIHGLMDAMRERVPLDLSVAGRGTPPVVLLPTLTRRLLDNRPMAEEMARWAVESWAIALGVVSLDEVVALHPVKAPAPVPITQPVPVLLRREFEPEMVWVAAGEFWMGSEKGDRGTLEREKPDHQVDLDGYWIGKTPVTVAEFARFVERSGYHTTAENNESERTWRRPMGKGSHLAGRESHPVIQVSWEDAMEYCRWLSRMSGRQYGLPSEAQWEKAARGTDRRVHPWGNGTPDKSRCNIDLWFKDTTPVGAFSPAGDSPYGCVDMVGNVWEWCADWWGETYYQASPLRNPAGPVTGKYHSVRGASWGNSRWYARCAYRDWNSGSYFDYYLGFRVALLQQNN